MNRHLLTADATPDLNGWVLALYLVLVVALAAGITWSCYRAWKDREETTDE